MPQLVQQLPLSDLDIIGDVHGEIGALCTLLDRLGYDDQGRHPQNRHLVFVGDLIDRGPDSLGVLDLVIPMCQSKRASLIAGNHELNILRKKKKHGNKWFYGTGEHLFTPKDTENPTLLSHKTFTRCIYKQEKRDSIVQFFQTLPIALEREDLRVVHACWDNRSIQALKSGNQNLIERYNELEDELAQRTPAKVHISKDEEPTRQAIAQNQQRDLFLQNNNPIKVISSGIEQEAKKVMFIGGSPRYTSRQHWWKDYQGPPVIFGHYWRRRSEQHIPEDNPLDMRKSPPPYVFSNFSSSNN
ncbi:MAG: hypothetical protein CL916_06280, partial [Deltaproteobacteria bacterium]|nr:hypothetical protein [Deltaproteobacteria bacterium]